MLTDELRGELKQRLLGERQRLHEEIAALMSDGVRSDTFQDDESDSVDQHPADDASEMFEREKNLTVVRTLEISLQEVNDALGKFDNGTYGQCKRCGKPIGEKRLRALPEATHCIECQELLERQAHATARQ